MGIVTCRSIDDMGLFIARCGDTYHDSRGLVIPLVDDDFYKLLHLRADENEIGIDLFMQNRFHEIAFGHQ